MLRKCWLLAALVGLASALPAETRSSAPAADIAARAVTATAEDMTKLRFYAQYATSTACNVGVPPGTLIACGNDGCPTLEANGVQAVASFQGPVTGVAGYVSTDPVRKEIVIAVRGSSNIRNWLTDFNFAQVACDFVSDCMVHAGFLNSWKETSANITAAVAAALAANPSYSIVATGHSLGAALATLAAATLRQAGYAVDLITYGSPRVGNAALADFVTAQPGAEYRVTHFDDPVPRLPPIFLNYRHTSPEYWLAPGNATRVDYAPSDVQVCTGDANVMCNAGTTGLDGTAHVYYLEYLSTCATSNGSLSWRRQEDVSDEELELRLNAYAELDRQYAATLVASAS